MATPCRNFKYFVVVVSFFWGADFVGAAAADNLPLVPSNRYHPMNNSPIVPVVVAGAPFWFAIFLLFCCGGGGGCCCCGCYSTHTNKHKSHTHAHTAMQAMHTNTHSHTYTHTEVLFVFFFSLFCKYVLCCCCYYCCLLLKTISIICALLENLIDKKQTINN